MSPDVQKKRLIKMFAVNGVCLLAGAAALFAYITTKELWTLLALAALFAIGFAAQVWFIAGVAKAGRAQ